MRALIEDSREQWNIPNTLDLLWVEQRIDVAILSEALDVKRRGGKVVYDCCDSGAALGYWAAPSMIVEMMALADVVITDTPERARWIRIALRLGPIRVLENSTDGEPLPAVDTVPVITDSLRLCWHGYSGNLSSLERYVAVLRDIPYLEVVTIGATPEDVQRFLPGLIVEQHPWDLSTFAPILQSCHLCLLSHEGGWHSRMKSAHKMATAIGLGVPVIASSTPDYERMALRLGVPQAVITCTKNLRKRIETLRSTESRLRYLQTALPKVNDCYAPAVFRLRLRALLEDIASMTPRGYVSTGWRRAVHRSYSRLLFAPPFR
jgi:hypothetical protein